ncbi:MAG: type VI secretion system baseplate subunit TssF [Sphingobacteriaceae bacterium]|nr:type VI secretion system baseplate subunit TssF [Cytophagaceae bacterium]
MEDFEPRQFARERVKSRMLRQAAELWGYAETELDAFDPLVSLLVEACAVEFEKISVEINDTQTRLLDRLARLMNPDVDVALPACALVQVRAAEPQTTLLPDAQLMYRKSGGAKGTAQPDVFFSPIQPTLLLDGALRWMATAQTLFQVENGLQKNPVAQASGQVVGLTQSLWLGLELHDDVRSLNGLTFFFDWQNSPDRQTWSAYLPAGRWLMETHELRTRMGWPAPTSSPEVAPGSSLEKEFDTIGKAERRALATFEANLVTLEAAPALTDLPRQPYPGVFAELFNPRDLKALKTPLLWVQVQFPHALPPQALDAVLCSINVVPVLNRRLNKLTYKLTQALNIIPLTAEGAFLAVKDVRNTRSTRFRPVPLGNLLDLDLETYTLQYGVSRFDERNAREVLGNLLDIVRDESSSFSALGEDFLASVIRELNQSLARLEAKVGVDQVLRKNSIPYVVIKPKAAGETVFIEYWTGNGAQGNRIPAGSRLIPYSDLYVRKDEIFLMTSSQGGRDKLNVAEKINGYRKALLTRNRIVTLEDVKAVCFAEFGPSLRQAEVRRGFVVGATPEKGFLRCVQIDLTPAANAPYSAEEWQQRGESLRLLLDTQSVSGLPYVVRMVPSTR